MPYTKQVIERVGSELFSKNNDDSPVAMRSRQGRLAFFADPYGNLFELAEVLS